MASAANLPTAITPLVVTMGEPAGVGGEITLKAWATRTAHNLRPFFVLDDPKRLEALVASLPLEVPIVRITNPCETADAWDRGLPVLSIGEVSDVTPGKPSPQTGQAILKSIDQAVALTLEGKAAAVVTNPIQKSALYDAGFPFQGHTDYLASLCEVPPTPVMMLASDDLRVVPVTVHIPLSEVPRALTQEVIIITAETVHRALQQDFGIKAPRITVAGLNPHAGESGSIGSEETDVINLAIAHLIANGRNITGPFPADSLFHAAARKNYDAAICMYHDQALIPIKTIAFDTAVNVTLGLPFVRTSPDHGTALDIAGTGAASPTGLISALKMATTHAAARANK